MDKFKQKVEVKKLLESIRELSSRLGAQSCNYELLQIKEKLFRAIDKSR